MSDPFSYWYHVIGSALGFVSMIILVFKYFSEKPILRKTLQKSSHNEKTIWLNFILHNSGERGTSVTNIRVIRINGQKADINPIQTTYWAGGKSITSNVMLLREHSSFAVNVTYDVPNVLPREDITIDVEVEHTITKYLMSNLKIEYKM